MSEACDLCGADESVRPAHGINRVGICELCRHDAINRPRVVGQGVLEDYLSARGISVADLEAIDPPKPDGQEIDGELQ